jgi:hypothetical protein
MPPVLGPARPIVAKTGQQRPAAPTQNPARMLWKTTYGRSVLGDRLTVGPQTLTLVV